MRWLVVLVVPFVVEGVTTQAFAAQYRVTLDRIEAGPTKVDGRPWDGDGSAPDLEGRFQAGLLHGRQCKPSSSVAIAKRQDTFVFAPALSVIVKANSAAQICVYLELIEADVLDSDRVGRTSFLPPMGTSTVNVGSIKVTLSLTLVAAATEGVLSKLIPPRGPLQTPLLRVTVYSATIAPRRKDGTPWDAAKDPNGDAGMGLADLAKVGLAFYASGGMAALGTAVKADQAQKSRGPTHAAQTATAPDTRVLLKIGRQVMRTAVAPNTYEPAWKASVLMRVAHVRKDPIEIHVVDEDGLGDEPVGTRLVEATELRGQQVLRLEFGSVDELVLRIETVHEKAAGKPFEGVIRRGANWLDTGFDVVAGQLVMVASSGELCSAAGRCVGGDGDPGRRIEIQGFAQQKVRVGQLVVVIGDAIYAIGKAGRVLAGTSGRMLVGVASGEIGSGSIQVGAAVFFGVE